MAQTENTSGWCQSLSAAKPRVVVVVALLSQGEMGQLCAWCVCIQAAFGLCAHVCTRPAISVLVHGQTTCTVH